MAGSKPASKLRKGLTAIFMTAVMGGALVIGIQSHTPQNDNLPASAPVTQTIPHDTVDAPYAYSGQVAPYQSRHLTAGEEKLVKSLFGADADTGSIRLHFFKDARKGQVSDVINGNKSDIEIYGLKNAADDYSVASASNFGTFVYEMTRLWQNRTGNAYTLGNPSYSGYPLSSEYVFQSYGQIQQAQIMEDYALRFLHPDRQSYWLPSEYGDDKSDTDPFLQDLVEGQFPSATEARLAFAHVEVRGLTTGEAALLRGIFGSQLDTAGIRLNLHPQDYSDIVGSVEADAVADFWGPANHSKDYSREKDGEKFGTFIHELTHNWQRQTNWKFTLDIEDKDKDKYSYPLNAKYRFTEYTTEQQAAIIEDYARRFLHPSHSHTYLNKTYKNPNAYDNLLIKVVEDQFPDARQLREQYKRDESAPRVSVAPSPRRAFG